MMDRTGDLADAIYIAISTFISYSEVGDERDNGSALPTESISPEQFMIVRDLFSKLAADAQWLVTTLLTDPDRLATPANKKLSIYSITMALRKKKWSRSRIDWAFREVQKFLHEMEST